MSKHRSRRTGGAGASPSDSTSTNNGANGASEASGVAGTPESDTEEQSVVLRAIDALKRELLEKMDAKAKAQSTELKNQASQMRTEFRAAVKQIEENVTAVSGRLSELETGVSANSDVIESMKSEIFDLRTELSELRDRCEDAESRSRRFNVRIWGVKEGRESGQQPSKFVANMLQQALGLDSPPTLDIAHRSLRSKPTRDDAPPRAFVVRCHYFQEKELMLKKAAEMKEFTTAEGDVIRLQQDFTQAVANRRAAFSEVRGLLRGVDGVRFGIKFPATFRITTSDGRETRFTDPKAAKAYVLKKVVRKE